MIRLRTLFTLPVCVGIALGLASVSPAHALTPPAEIPYQAYLTDNTGAAVDGLVDFKARLWSVEMGGDQSDLLYAEEHFDVMVDAGLFNLRIGAGVYDAQGGEDPFSTDLFDEAELWLELEIEGEILMPRRQIKGVPYAFRANIGPNTVGSSQITNNSVSTVDIQDGTVSGADVASSAISSLHIANNSISGIDIANNTLTGIDITNNTLTGDHIVNGSLTGSDIANGTIESIDIANNSITGADVEDESLTEGDILDTAGADYASSESTVTLGPDSADIQLLTVTITAPASSRVIVNATGEFVSVEDDAWVHCELTTNTSIDLFSGQRFMDPGGPASFALTRGFAVGAGPSVFRLLCNTLSHNSDDVTFRGRFMTAIYVPTEY